MIADQRPTRPRIQATQPMGWPSAAFQNAAIQARQEADRHKARADRLAALNRRLVAHTALALTVGVAIGAGLAALALVIGYAFGVGLLGIVR